MNEQNNSFNNTSNNTSNNTLLDSEDRSIRRIPISRKMKPTRPTDGSVSSRGNSFSGSAYPEKKKSRFGLWLSIFFLIIIFFFVFSFVFSGVKIKVTPKQEAVLISGEFTAFRDAQSGELSFDVMTLGRDVSIEVVATGEEFVEEKASGKIVIYNDYSSAGQKLIDNTRFETPNGLIFRIKEGVTVPGQKVVDGKTVPGSIEVNVFADEAGENFNIGLSDFTIPGLKSDPRYSKFYARSKTVMSGGVSGMVRKASDSDLEKASRDLESQLESEILVEAMSVKPEGFILLDNAFVIESDLKTANGSDGSVVVTKSATFYGLIFNEKEFAEFVADKTVSSYDGSLVELVETDSLVFEMDASDKANLPNTESVNFELNGNTKVVWTFDEEALIESLKGQSKNDVDSILSRYTGIESAEVVVRPFWKRTIAENDKKIKLEKIIQ
jgi:hypothetical protein